MKVLDYIKSRRSEKPLHFTLIDPDKQSPAEAGELAKKVKEFGTDAIMVGGSQVGMLINIDETVKSIKSSGLPVILFPFSHSALSRHADAVFFMSLLNSRSTQYVIEEQVKGSVLVKEYGLEALPMAYLIIESGKMTSAAFVGDVKPIPGTRPEFALGYALAAQYLGMRFVYLEAGSGAEKSVPEEMVSLVRKNIDASLLLIVGGGIRDAQTAREKIDAGADIIVSGNIAENDSEKLKEIIEAVKK